MSRWGAATTVPPFSYPATGTHYCSTSAATHSYCSTSAEPRSGAAAPSAAAPSAASPYDWGSRDRCHLVVAAVRPRRGIWHTVDSATVQEKLTPRFVVACGCGRTLSYDGCNGTCRPAFRKNLRIRSRSPVSRNPQSTIMAAILKKVRALSKRTMIDACNTISSKTSGRRNPVQTRNANEPSTSNEPCTAIKQTQGFRNHSTLEKRNQSDNVM